MKADYFISLKYLFSKTKYNLVSFISGFSILVLSIAYFSFLTILSVFSGLENYSLQFSKSFDPDIKIERKINRKLLKKLIKTKGKDDPDTKLRRKLRGKSSERWKNTYFS